MSSVRVQHDVYAQVLVNHVYDADVVPRIKSTTGDGETKRIVSHLRRVLPDEYATNIRLIDEMLEQRYNYVIQSRRTIETFPVKRWERASICRSTRFVQCAVAKYPLLEIIAEPRRQLHCQVEKNTSHETNFLRFFFSVQVTEDKTQPVSPTPRFHGNQYDVHTLKSSETPLQTLVKMLRTRFRH